MRDLPIEGSSLITVRCCARSLRIVSPAFEIGIGIPRLSVSREHRSSDRYEQRSAMSILG
jgi:hypothetical protein